MDQDERYQQRWEFRRREVDGDTSSDDNGSKANGERADKSHKLVTDLVLLENDEASDAPGSQRHDKLVTYNSIDSQTVKADEKKIKSSKKKKKVVQKKPEGRAVQEMKRKRKLKINEMVMFKDLKMFADSLVQDLAIAREIMLEHMREEMKKLVASRSNLSQIKKNARRSQTKKVCPQNGIETGVTPQSCPGGSMPGNDESNVATDARKFPKAVAEAAKHDKVLELTTTNELHKADRLRLPATAHMNLAYGSEQVVSSSHFPLPTILQKPQFQNQRNGIHLNDHIPQGLPMNNSGSQIEISKLMAATRFSRRFAEFQPEERFGIFSHSRHKGVDLLRQNSSKAAIQGIGFPIPLNQGTENGSKMSSLTYCENSFMDNNRVGLRMNGSIARFLGTSPSSSEPMFPNTIIGNIPHKTERESVTARLQELKDGQFSLTSLRKNTSRNKQLSARVDVPSSC